MKNVFILLLFPLMTFSQEIENEIFIIPDEEAYFPGGMKEMQNFIAENIIYPEVAVNNHIRGRVTVRFYVNKEGVISDVKIMKGIPDCPECDKEVIRVVKLMPNWIPGKNLGEPIDSYYILPVIFYIQ